MLKNRMSFSADSRFTHHIQPNVVLFPFMYYPFPNGIVTYEYFKTILSCQANQQTIQKIMKIKLQSMIKIKKVIKTKKKQNILLNVKMIDQNKNSPKQPQKIQNFYSFYYQIIPFSLISLLKGQAGHCTQALLKKLDRIFIKKQITKLVSDLQKIGVFYLIKLQNIGVTLTGNIKAYIAPNILFGNIKLTQNEKVVILKNLIRILKQIDSKFIKKQKKIDYIQCSIEKILPDEFSTQMNMLKTQNLQKGQINNSSIFIIKNQQRSFGQQQQNFIRHPGSSNNIQLKMQQKNKQQFKKNKYMGRSQQSIASSKDQFSLNIMNVKQQKKKIQQITKEIEEIRKKIKQKAQAKNKKTKQKGLVQEYPTNAKENQTIKKSPLKSSRNNLAINLIQKQLNKNIIQEQIQVQTKIKKKRKSSQSSINFYQGQIPTQNNINCINIYHAGPNMNSHSIFLDNDTVSCDTYQMEIGRDHQMPKIKPNNNGFRNTLTPNKRNQQIGGRELSSQQVHSHVQKKPFYQSAGNKMFSHIVNNLIKPQFMPKKSNIFEDPEEQNEKSVSIRKSNRVQKKDQKQEQRNPDNKIKTIQKKTIANENLIKNQSDSKKDNLNRMKSLDQFKMHINGLKSMKKLSVTKQQQKNTLQLKVKNVLQKTKNAIAMLNKVKSKLKPSSSSIQKNNIASLFK